MDSSPEATCCFSFYTFAAAGLRLAELHVSYEQQPEFPLHRPVIYQLAT